MGTPIGHYGAGDVLWHHSSTCDAANLRNAIGNTRKQEKLTIHQRTQRAVVPNFSGQCQL